MSNETWRDIPGLEGVYQASDRGRVRSLDRVREQLSRWGTPMQKRYLGKVLTPQPFSNGYLWVNVDGKAHLVHRLIALAFVPGSSELQVNHKNGKRTDNRAVNLEWLSCSDNHRHSYRELPRKQHAKTTPVVVGSKRYPSVLAAANALGVAVGSIGSALQRGHRCKGMEVFNG